MNIGSYDKSKTQDCSDAYCIIGAGPFGLATARALNYKGIPYEQLEAAEDIGGVWLNGIYHRLHTISSRKMTQFPEYPMPSEYPDFPNAKQILDYLRRYASRFGLRAKIQFNTRVRSCWPLANGRWLVTLTNGDTRLYRGLLVCHGHHWQSQWPSYPGHFSGEYIHANSYKHPAQLEGKRVLVIGCGNSACDIASEAARVASSCAISIRAGAWLLPKTFFGRPLGELYPAWVPKPLQRLLLRMLLFVTVGDYRRYGLDKPTDRIFDRLPTINGELLHHLRHGRIKPKPAVGRFDGNSVEFVDGTRDSFDMIVAATGYKLSFPFLPQGVVSQKDNLALLYAGCVSADFKNLYVIGSQQSRHGFGPFASSQAELVTELLELQEMMELPIGLILKLAGARLPSTQFVDPSAATRITKNIRARSQSLIRLECRCRNELIPGNLSRIACSGQKAALGSI